MSTASDLRRHVARVAIEFTSPFLVGSGDSDLVVDLVPVWDASGLPVLPGTSIAGVLRHAYTAATTPEAAKNLFGDHETRSSRVWVTWGHIHAANDRPMDGFRGDPPSDPVLATARALTVRDHVRIDHRGTAVDGAKFDQGVVCAGHRFTFDLEVEGGDGDELRKLMQLLRSGSLRLGRGGQRGLGSFQLARCSSASFDLRDKAQRQQWLQLPRNLAEATQTLHPQSVARDVSLGNTHRLVLMLQPVECWSVGGSEPWVPDRLDERRGEDHGKLPDLCPVRDQRVRWQGSQGTVGELEMYVPGTSIKGALAHRVAFHANAQAGRFADQGADSANCTGEASSAVQWLFGSADKVKAQRGRVNIDDVWLAPRHSERLLPIMHNGIDRFTGGTMPGVLFEELVIDGGPPLEVVIRVTDWKQMPETVREAFHRAVRDLCRGRLQLGAGAGRGHGYFEMQDWDQAWAKFEQEALT